MYVTEIYAYVVILKFSFSLLLSVLGKYDKNIEKFHSNEQDIIEYLTFFKQLLKIS